MAEPLPGGDAWQEAERSAAEQTRSAPKRVRAESRVIRAPETPTNDDTAGGPGSGATSEVGLRIAEAGGRSLGTFRNTYYDFPRETDFKGKAVPLKNPSCGTIREVPRDFFESLCVQGSGTLKSGETVSFAKRDCECAELCPRTEQRICFDALDARAFPWGRGATGKAITPLLTVAVDTSVIPLGSVLYVPEFDGLPRDATSSQRHDGCFVAQDRGIRVQGQHVDVFTGQSSMTSLWNRLIPSNQGVTVVLDSPRCKKP